MRKVLDFFGKFEEFDENKVFWTAFWISVVVMVLHILFFHKVERDSAYLYTAMAREFGDGRYKYAFYPAIPPLMSILAGCLCKIGFTAFGAVKTVAMIFFVGGLFPFRFLMNKSVGSKLASWACLVYACSSYLIRYSVYGYPFALKMFFLIFSTYLVVRFADTLKLRFSIYLGLALGGLALSRGEGIGLAPLFIAWFLFLPLYLSYKNDKFTYHKRILSKQVIGIIFIVISFIFVCWPQMIYVYNRSGIPITELRTGEILKRNLEKIFPNTVKQLISNAPAKVKSSASQNKLKNSKPNNAKKIESVKFTDKKYKPPKDSYDILTFKRSLIESVEGLYPILIIFALIGIFRKLRNREFKIYDLLFFSVILYNAVMFLGTVGVTRRYTAVTQPFGFNFVVLGGYYIYSWDKWKVWPSYIKKYWKNFCGIAITVIFIILLVNGLNRFNKYIFKGNQYYSVGEWIKNNKDLFPGKKYVKVNNFYTNRLPVIFCIISEYGFWGECDYVGIDTHYTYSYDDIVKNMRAHNATVMIFDKRIREICPTFMDHWQKNFDKVKELPEWKTTIFRLQPRK